MGKMLIPKPFMVVKILDFDRVLLDNIKLCLPKRGVGGGGTADKKWNDPFHLMTCHYLDHYLYSMEFLCSFLKPHFAEKGGGVAKCRPSFEITTGQAIRLC